MYSFCPVSSMEPVKDAFMELCIQSVPFYHCVLPITRAPTSGLSLYLLRGLSGFPAWGYCRETRWNAWLWVFSRILNGKPLTLVAGPLAHLEFISGVTGLFSLSCGLSVLWEGDSLLSNPPENQVPSHAIHVHGSILVSSTDLSQFC